jgi:hypothetical protein
LQRSLFGTREQREFSTINAIVSSPAADFRATAVTFVDGTHWNAAAQTGTAPAHH